MIVENLSDNVTANVSANTTSPPWTGVGCVWAHEMNYWLPLALCVAGVIGNVLSFIVIHVTYKRTSMNLLLKSLAVADSLYLMLEISYDSLHYAYAPFDYDFVWHMARVAQYSSVWHLVVIGAFRYTAICFPFKASKLCSHTRATATILVTWLASVAFQGVFWFGPDDKTFAEIYNLYVINAIVFVLPFALLIFFNVCILRAVRAAAQNIARHNGGEETSTEVYEVTKVVVAITLVFFITYMPYPLATVDFYIFDHQMFMPSVGQMSCFLAWFSIFIKFKTQYISSATNFLIYCMLRQSFRRKMADLLCCKGNDSYTRQSFTMRRANFLATTRSRSNTVITDYVA